VDVDVEVVVGVPVVELGSVGEEYVGYSTLEREPPLDEGGRRDFGGDGGRDSPPPFGLQLDFTVVDSLIPELNPRELVFLLVARVDADSLVTVGELARPPA